MTAKIQFIISFVQVRLLKRMIIFSFNYQHVIMNFSRRSIIQGVGAGVLSQFVTSELANKANELPDNLTVLFQGDSITDAGRDRGAYYANHPSGMGQGYVRHIVTHLLGQYPDQDLKFYNRGISGHKVFQLLNRWEEDCLQLQPDVLSILIGVNDFWHTLTHGYQGTSNVYQKDLSSLLQITKDLYPNIKIIIGEPFVLHEGTAIQKEKWIGRFEAYQASSRELAQAIGAQFIPYQKIFDEALGRKSTSYWCPDGVHPSMAGNYLMAEAWLKSFFALF